MFASLIVLLAVLGLLSGITFASQSEHGIDIDTAHARAEDMLGQMTLDEKLTMLAGHPGIYVGNVFGNRRLNIPSLNLQDGPQGFRVTDRTGDVGSTTAWPSALSIAASWDEDLVHRWGVAMGEEFRGKGANVALAPGIGIAREPNAGRNFEYLCGEDPVLGAKLVRQVVRGIQQVGVIANAKHWINNEIEDHRMLVSANVDERTRWELYYLPFQAAVNAGVLSVMCAYNRINDEYACENADTITHLKKDFGFGGFLVSDWTATHTTTKSLKSGLDLEMPFGTWYSEQAVNKALSNENITVADVDAAVVRTLTAMYAIGLFDRRNPGTQEFEGVTQFSENDVVEAVGWEKEGSLIGNPRKNVTSAAHNALARELAAKSTVLLKNDNSLLPITPSTFASSPSSCIAVIGDQSIISGGGSGHVEPYYTITQTQGISNYVFEHASDYKDVTVVYDDGTNVTSATSLASSCALAVVIVATTSLEGSDRRTLALGEKQDALVEAIAAVKPTSTVVSVITPGASLLPWAEKVPAIVVSWLPGQEAGNALADVLFGVVNPYARLPVTFPNVDNEIGFTEAEYPGVGMPPEAAYNEQLLIGYRWYEAKGVAPAFSFGHGLSYTTFAYDYVPTALKGIEIDPNFVKASKSLSVAEVIDTAFNYTRGPVIKVNFQLTNTGTRDGSEIPQLYFTYPATASEPARQLKTFTKVDLLAGEQKTVQLVLTIRDFSVWNVDAHNWEVPVGEYTVTVGPNSKDVKCTFTFTVAE